MAADKKKTIKKQDALIADLKKQVKKLSKQLSKVEKERDALVKQLGKQRSKAKEAVADAEKQAMKAIAKARAAVAPTTAKVVTVIEDHSPVEVPDVVEKVVLADRPDDTWTVTRLRTEARARGVAGYSRMTKEQLLSALA